MKNLKTEIKKIEKELNTIKEELSTINKDETKDKISKLEETNKLLEDLLENKDIQNKYPKYNKLKKLYYIIPSILVTLLTIILIVISLLMADITLTTFLPLIIIAIV